MKLLTLARDLQRRKARERQRLFVAEGVRTVEALMSSPLVVRGVLASPLLDQTPRGASLRDTVTQRGIDMLDVSAADFASAADTDGPQGVLAIAEVPDRRLETLAIGDDVRLLVLDAVQDPGNVGAVVRTAAAFGATATIALPGTADLWGAKSVRSGMGAQFSHPSFHCTWDEVEVFLRDERVTLWGADARGEPIGAPAPARLALAVGNEGAGLSNAVRGRAERLVSLPIAPEVESLNVAVAAGVMLFALTRA